MTEKALLQNMLHLSTAIAQNEKRTETVQWMEQVLQQAGISPDADYYNGALQNLQQAYENKKETSVSFWQAYQFSLCRRLQTARTEQARQSIHQTILTVKAILSILKGDIINE